MLGIIDTTIGDERKQCDFSVGTGTVGPRFMTIVKFDSGDRGGASEEQYTWAHSRVRDISLWVSWMS